MLCSLRTATLASFLVTMAAAHVRAQTHADLDGDSLRSGVARAAGPSNHKGAITAGFSFGSTSRGLLVGAEAANRLDGEFVALRAAIDPDRRRYDEYVDRARAVKPGTVFQRYEANLVLGAEWNVGPLLLGVDAGFGVVGFFNVQRRLLSRFDTVYFVSELPLLGIPVDLHARLPLGARLSLVGRLHVHVNFFEPTYGGAAELHYLLGHFPFDPSADGPVPDRPEASDSSGATPGLAPGHIVYGELNSTIIISNVLSFNYERIINRHVSVRAGVGVGYYFDTRREAILTGSSGLLMLNYLTSQDGGLETGLGVCGVQGDESKSKQSAWWTRIGARPVFAVPAAALGYRHQPSTGGDFLRIGVSWVHYYGAGVHVALGYAF